MTGAAHHNSQADHYFSILKNLDAASKLDLIARLSQSIIIEQEPQPATTTNGKDSIAQLFGALKTAESAEEIIGRIRSSRGANREIEPF